MVESIPFIPLESEKEAMNVPQFSTHLTPFSPSHKANTPVNSQKTKVSSNISRFQRTKAKSCACPDILVADDDPFQEHFYTTLFRRSVDFTLQPDNAPKFKVFRSGEALLDGFSSLKACDCGCQMLIITDYEMGRKNLNGVETALNLRKGGHKGPIVLRTSENKEDLCKRHPSLENLFERNVISCMLDKDNHLKTSKTLKNLFKSAVQH